MDTAETAVLLIVFSILATVIAAVIVVISTVRLIFGRCVSVRNHRNVISIIMKCFYMNQCSFTSLATRLSPQRFFPERKMHVKKHNNHTLPIKLQ